MFNRVTELLGVKELYFFGLTVVKGRCTPHLSSQPETTAHTRVHSSVVRRLKLVTTHTLAMSPKNVLNSVLPVKALGEYLCILSACL